MFIYKYRPGASDQFHSVHVVHACWTVPGCAHLWHGRVFTSHAVFSTAIVWQQTGCAALVSALPGDERPEWARSELSAVQVTGCLHKNHLRYSLLRPSQHSYGRKRIALNAAPSPGAASPSCKHQSLLVSACVHAHVCLYVRIYSTAKRGYVIRGPACQSVHWQESCVICLLWVGPRRQECPKQCCSAGFRF